MSKIGIPIPGTTAYWAAQREAVALVNAWQNDAWQNDKLIPAEELALLRRIAAHSLATRMMAALGHDVERLTAIVLRTPGLFEEDVDEDDEREDEDADPDAPPHGADWCKRGCQILHGMECGMCGYEGRGVWASQVDTVAEHCCHCNARTYQSPDGICELCGKDAETPDAPAPPTGFLLLGLRRGQPGHPVPPVPRPRTPRPGRHAPGRTRMPNRAGPRRTSARHCGRAR